MKQSSAAKMTSGSNLSPARQSRTVATIHPMSAIAGSATISHRHGVAVRKPDVVGPHSMAHKSSLDPCMPPFDSYALTKDPAQCRQMILQPISHPAAMYKSGK